MIKRFLPVSWHYALSNLKRKVFGYRTYAQFGEDAVLLELFKDKSDGRYVDVGAHHPYRYSNTYLLFKKGWHGVNIDPNPHTVALFNKARPNDENICAGVGNAGVLTYYRFSDPAVNTFTKEEAEKWKGKSFLTFLGTNEVEVKPLSQIITGSVDLFSIDAEGMDLEVLQSYKWEYYPKVIIIEGEDSGDFLEDKGYTLYARRGVSNIFVHNAKKIV